MADEAARLKLFKLLTESPHFHYQFTRAGMKRLLERCTVVEETSKNNWKIQFGDNGKVMRSAKALAVNFWWAALEEGKGKSPQSPAAYLLQALQSRRQGLACCFGAPVSPAAAGGTYKSEDTVFHSSLRTYIAVTAWLCSSSRVPRLTLS